MTDDFDDLDPSTLCDRCGEETLVIDTSMGLETWSEWVGATLCPDCWAEIDGEEAAVATQASVTTNGPEDDSRAAVQSPTPIGGSEDGTEIFVEHALRSRR